MLAPLSNRLAHVDMGKRAHVCTPLHVSVCAVGCVCGGGVEVEGWWGWGWWGMQEKP